MTDYIMECRVPEGYACDIVKLTDGASLALWMGIILAGFLLFVAGLIWLVDRFSR